MLVLPTVDSDTFDLPMMLTHFVTLFNQLTQDSMVSPMVQAFVPAPISTKTIANWKNFLVYIQS